MMTVAGRQNPAPTVGAGAAHVRPCAHLRVLLEAAAEPGPEDCVAVAVCSWDGVACGGPPSAAVAGMTDVSTLLPDSDPAVTVEEARS